MAINTIENAKEKAAKFNEKYHVNFDLDKFSADLRQGNANQVFADTFKGLFRDAIKNMEHIQDFDADTMLNDFDRETVDYFRHYQKANGELFTREQIPGHRGGISEKYWWEAMGKELDLLENSKVQEIVDDYKRGNVTIDLMIENAKDMTASDDENNRDTIAVAAASVAALKQANKERGWKFIFHLPTHFAEKRAIAKLEKQLIQTTKNPSAVKDGLREFHGYGDLLDKIRTQLSNKLNYKSDYFRTMINPSEKTKRMIRAEDMELKPGELAGLKTGKLLEAPEFDTFYLDLVNKNLEQFRGNGKTLTEAFQEHISGDMKESLVAATLQVSDVYDNHKDEPETLGQHMAESVNALFFVAFNSLAMADLPLKERLLMAQNLTNSLLKYASPAVYLPDKFKNLSDNYVLKQENLENVCESVHATVNLDYSDGQVYNALRDARESLESRVKANVQDDLKEKAPAQSAQIEDAPVVVKEEKAL